MSNSYSESANWQYLHDPQPTYWATLTVPLLIGKCWEHVAKGGTRMMRLKSCWSHKKCEVASLHHAPIDATVNEVRMTDCTLNVVFANNRGLYGTRSNDRNGMIWVRMTALSLLHFKWLELKWQKWNDMSGIIGVWLQNV